MTVFNIKKGASHPSTSSQLQELQPAVTRTTVPNSDDIQGHHLPPSPSPRPTLPPLRPYGERAEPLKCNALAMRETNPTSTPVFLFPKKAIQALETPIPATTVANGVRVEHLQQGNPMTLTMFH